MYTLYIICAACTAHTYNVLHMQDMQEFAQCIYTQSNYTLFNPTSVFLAACMCSLMFIYSPMSILPFAHLALAVPVLQLTLKLFPVFLKDSFFDNLLPFLMVFIY